MNEKKINAEIVKVLMGNFLPGTIENHDQVVEIDDFVNLWDDESRPVLSDIEETMEYLGFKKEECRVEFLFYVRFPEEEEEAVEVK